MYARDMDGVVVDRNPVSTSGFASMQEAYGNPIGLGFKVAGYPRVWDRLPMCFLSCKLLSIYQ